MLSVEKRKKENGTVSSSRGSSCLIFAGFSPLLTQTTIRLFPVTTYPALGLVGMLESIPAVEGCKAGLHPVLVTSSSQGHVEREKEREKKQKNNLDRSDKPNMQIWGLWTVVGVSGEAHRNTQGERANSTPRGLSWNQSFDQEATVLITAPLHCSGKHACTFRKVRHRNN